MTDPAATEAIYEALAERLDAVGEPQSRLFLAKAALALARALGDPKRAMEIIADAALDLEEPG